MTARGPIERAAQALDRGELVVYPTDTLLGIGARADRPAAVARLLRAKDRPAGAPLSIAVSSYEEIEPWGRLTPDARALVRARLPGPYTVIVPARPGARRAFAPAIVGPRGSIGIRIPDHPVARELARRCGPIVSTSANRHGAPPARTAAEARRAFGPRVRVYLAGGPAPSGRPSELLDLTGGRVRRIARPR